MGYAIRAGAVHSNDCWKNIFPHDSPIYLRHRWLQVPITDCVLGFSEPPTPLHTHTHSHYSKNKKSRPVSVKLCVWDNTTSWKNIYYRHAHTAVQWPHFKTINRSKWIGSVYPSAKHVLTPSNEMSAGLMMPAYYLTVNTNDPLHSVSVRPPPGNSMTTHTHLVSHRLMDRLQHTKQNLLLGLCRFIAHNSETRSWTQLHRMSGNGLKDNRRNLSAVLPQQPPRRQKDGVWKRVAFAARKRGWSRIKQCACSGK